MQVTYHANKLQENQYTLHAAVMIRKIRKLRQFGKFLSDSGTSLGYVNLKGPISSGTVKQCEKYFMKLKVLVPIIYQIQKA